MQMDSSKVAAEETKESKERYIMNAKDQSECLMFLFSRPIDGSRWANTGADSASYLGDEENMAACFFRLGFQVKFYRDLDQNGIRTVVEMGVLAFNFIGFTH